MTKTVKGACSPPSVCLSNFHIAFLFFVAPEVVGVDAPSISELIVVEEEVVFLGAGFYRIEMTSRVRVQQTLCICNILFNNRLYI